MTNDLPKALVRGVRSVADGLRFAFERRHGDRCEVAGHSARVAPGVAHPLAGGSAPFLLRTVGPMVARGQRVLDLATGCGIGALVAASRGATVVALDPDPAAVSCAEANLRAAGLLERVEVRLGGSESMEEEAPFDLVWWRGRQDPAGQDQVGALLAGLPGLIGERGRLVLAVDRTTTMARFVRSRLPDGYRAVRLARSPGLLATWEALCIGWDREAARARRHAERQEPRSDDDKAAISRRRWASGSPARTSGPGPDGRADEPPPEQDVG